MGEFKFTTRDTTSIDVEKTLPSKQVAVEKKPLITKSLMKVQDKVTNPIVPERPSEANQIINSVLNARKYIVEEVSANFEKKLEKLDDAIIELISCKAENERLKGKIDNLTKDNYKFKRELKRFKSVMPGLFIKMKKDGLDF